MLIYPFAIVTAPYITTGGSESLGLFVVLHSEELDKDVHFAKNLVGLKITSKPLFVDRYYYNLSKTMYPFLDKDSWIQCSKPHTLDMNRAKYIGNLKPGHRMAIYRLFKSFIHEAENQMLNGINLKN